MENPAAYYRYECRSKYLCHQAGCRRRRAILGWILAYFHYAANTTVQSASAVQGVVLLFTLVPSVFYVLTAVSIKFYGLTENRMNGIVDDLKHGTFAES